ncbi:hypothetical protein HYPSUDRAFT_1064337 [Hypholoma sublateritium FD-334 SS-4]|uniref:Protein kinase domain-containing protein n=1 Tax=Hypholoma sublateritium (strain FD-334 SS-4) TaxID=945553 RepID=A0A0D2NIW8_HYPSF|nr:hypothetical protein HYPSUDRAFT_1064337 [Hypholoma sublateritium FD-334 SS-4]
MPAGKQTPNGLPLWGATVLDFFLVERAPGHAWMTAVNSSRLLAWAKEVGELEHAKEEIAWAEEEENPKELFPYDMARLIKDADYPGNPVTELRDEEHRLPNGRMSAMRYPTFQNCLPLHLLPEKLIVHDPDNTLRMGQKFKGGSGECDAPRIYKLELTQETRDAIATARTTPADSPPKKADSDPIHTTKSKDATTRKVKEEAVLEPMMAAIPPPPSPPLSTPEAHLYINADDKLGEGNHSHVYRVAWEIPRSLVMEPYLCDQCITESMFKKLEEEAPEVKTSTNEKGTLSTVEVTMPDVDTEFIWADTGLSETVTKAGESTVHLEYEGLMSSVPIDVKWSTPGNVCKHEEERNHAPMPTTFKVDVSAKLSYKGDNHLPREAQNYQNFPGHFFQHWSGYNIVWPGQDPTPALAVVPQFYGYYVPEDGQAKDGEYLSPILLLENCGTPVNVDDLNIDDRNECASLLFRMHAEGWLHNSFFPRNVLMQYGDITQWPAFRQEKDRRFRIIDFGRSGQYAKSRDWDSARIREERECKRTLGITDFPHL